MREENQEGKEKRKGEQQTFEIFSYLWGCPHKRNSRLCRKTEEDILSFPFSIRHAISFIWAPEGSKNLQRLGGNGKKEKRRFNE